MRITTESELKLGRRQDTMLVAQARCLKGMMVGALVAVWSTGVAEDRLASVKINNTPPPASDTTGTDGRLPVGAPGTGDDSHVGYAWVLKDGGTYKMWYSGHDGSAYRIYYATSPDGLTWTKYNNAVPAASDTTGTDGRIPLGTAGKGDDTLVFGPSVIKEGDGSFKMWYAGFQAGASRIFCATSPDGLTWTKCNNAIEAASDTTGTDGRIPLGTAGRGDVNCTESPSVIKDGGAYKMWYAGKNSAVSSNRYSIYYATSPDGLTWTKYNNAITVLSDTTGTEGRIPCGESGGDTLSVRYCAVVKDGGAYCAWYSGAAVSGSERIYHATSPDGLTWTKCTNAIPNPSDTTGTCGRIPLGTSDTGDDVQTLAPAVIEDGNVFRIWYVGYDGGTLRIYAAATMPPVGTVITMR